MRALLYNACFDESVGVVWILLLVLLAWCVCANV